MKTKVCPQQNVDLSDLPLFPHLIGHATCEAGVEAVVCGIGIDLQDAPQSFHLPRSGMLRSSNMIGGKLLLDYLEPVR